MRELSVLELSFLYISSVPNLKKEIKPQVKEGMDGEEIFQQSQRQTKVNLYNIDGLQHCFQMQNI